MLCKKIPQGFFLNVGPKMVVVVGQRKAAGKPPRIASVHLRENWPPSEKRPKSNSLSLFRLSRLSPSFFVAAVSCVYFWGLGLLRFYNWRGRAAFEARPKPLFIVQYKVARCGMFVHRAQPQKSTSGHLTLISLSPRRRGKGVEFHAHVNVHSTREPDVPAP